MKSILEFSRKYRKVFHFIIGAAVALFVFSLFWNASDLPNEVNGIGDAFEWAAFRIFVPAIGGMLWGGLFGWICIEEPQQMFIKNSIFSMDSILVTGYGGILGGYLWLIFPDSAQRTTLIACGCIVAALALYYVWEKAYKKWFRK